MKRADLSREVTLGRTVAELVIIVAGVLIALGVDAWWSDRSEAVRGEAYLARIAEDLDTQLQLLDEASADLGAQLAGGDSLRALVRGGPTPGQDPFDLLMGMFGSGRYELPVADWTYTEMIGNAELGLIRDQALRRAVVQYHASAHRLDERIHETRELLRAPIYARLSATPVLSAAGSSEQVAEETLRFLAEPDVLPYLEQLQTYLRHRGILWDEWRDAARELRAQLP